MIIDLRTIPQDGPQHYELILEKGWWNPVDQDDQVLGINAPITARVDIYKAGNKYVMEGDMSGSLKIRCDRCLNPYDNEIKTGFKLFFTQPALYGSKSEIELLEEDMETGFINGEEIELYDILKEQLYLSLPIKSLCREDCLGLCPTCGIDMNIQRCQCRK
jgi:uncharacterized protein